MRTIIVALIGEVRKNLLISWTYKANWFVASFTLGFIFVGLVFFIGGVNPSPEKTNSMLLGYLIWMFATTAVSDLGFGLRGEITAGTLEQLEMSPAPVGVLLMGRVIATLVATIFQVTLIGLVMLLLFDVRIPLRLEALPAMLITLIGVFGFGFTIGGAVLHFKQIDAFSNLLMNALAFLNGTFLPISAMTPWLASIAKSLPTTQGIIVIREIILEGKSLAETWIEGSLVGLTLNSAAYFVVGWLVFSISERIAKNRGSLGQY